MEHFLEILLKNDEFAQKLLAISQKAIELHVLEAKAKADQTFPAANKAASEAASEPASEPASQAASDQAPDPIETDSQPVSATETAAETSLENNSAEILETGAEPILETGVEPILENNSIEISETVTSEPILEPESAETKPTEDQDVALALFIDDVDMTLLELLSAYSERGNIIEKLETALEKKEQDLTELGKKCAKLAKLESELEIKHSHLAADHSALLKEKADRQATLEKYKSADLVQVVGDLERQLAEQQKQCKREKQLLEQEKQISARLEITVCRLTKDLQKCEYELNVLAQAYRKLAGHYAPRSLYDRYCFGDY